MTVRYSEVLGPLREAYDGRAAWRDGQAKEAWKLAERRAFGDRLAPGARLLEVGAGTGQDSVYFREQGFAVVATDLSPAMVELCRTKASRPTSWTSCTWTFRRPRSTRCSR